MFAGAIEVVSGVWPKADRIIRTEVVVHDEAWDGARDGLVFA